MYDFSFVSVSLTNTSLLAGSGLHLASALSGGITKHLSLSHTDLRDDNFKILSAGLGDCKLQNLQ